MKLTAKVHLQPTAEQAKLLLQTMQEANTACDRISAWAWENKTFGQYKIHHGTYHDIKASTRLSAQVVVRCISKVTDAYRAADRKLDGSPRDRKCQRQFRPLGAITYDNRILSYKFDKRIASVWTVEPGRRAGRQKIPYLTGEHHARLLGYAQGEADLAYVKGKFYLLQTCDIPHEAEADRVAGRFDDVVGVDLGITNIASTDDGKPFAGEDLNRLRVARQKVRSAGRPRSLQAKGTKHSKRVLKRLSGRERTTVKIQTGSPGDHTIARKIVAKAKAERKAIAIEDLKGIRSSTNKRLRRSQRGLHNRWSFHQLQSYISYKAQREGIPVYLVPSPYTSQTCTGPPGGCCKKIGKRNGEKFFCETCGIQHADTNAAKNIRALGLNVIQSTVDAAESSTLFCEYVSFVGHVRQG